MLRQQLAAILQDPQKIAPIRLVAGEIRQQQRFEVLEEFLVQLPREAAQVPAEGLVEVTQAEDREPAVQLQDQLRIEHRPDLLQPFRGRLFFLVSEIGPGSRQYLASAPRAVFRMALEDGLDHPGRVDLFAVVQVPEHAPDRAGVIDRQFAHWSAPA